jgi:hypothetical protein
LKTVVIFSAYDRIFIEARRFPVHWVWAKLVMRDIVLGQPVWLPVDVQMAMVERCLIDLSCWFCIPGLEQTRVGAPCGPVRQS